MEIDVENKKVYILSPNRQGYTTFSAIPKNDSQKANKHKYQPNIFTTTTDEDEPS
jgi:hypothetical protein